MESSTSSNSFFTPLRKTRQDSISWLQSHQFLCSYQVTHSRCNKSWSRYTARRTSCRFGSHTTEGMRGLDSQCSKPVGSFQSHHCFQSHACPSGRTANLPIASWIQFVLSLKTQPRTLNSMMLTVAPVSFRRYRTTPKESTKNACKFVGRGKDGEIHRHITAIARNGPKKNICRQTCAA